MSEAIKTQGDPWWLGYAAFGGKLLETGTEVVNDYARAKLRKELDVDKIEYEQRANELSTNQTTLAAVAPAKGTDSDGSTLVEQVQFAGVSVQKSTLKTASITLAALVVGGLAVKALL